MDEEYAAQLADSWIKAILESQPQGAFGSNPAFYNTNNAETTAAAIARFRHKLIEELTKQQV